MNNPRDPQAKADAQRARELVEAALDLNSPLRREYGVDTVLSAAQVYATLATRG